MMPASGMVSAILAAPGRARGADTDNVLRELGYTEGTIAELCTRRTVG